MGEIGGHLDTKAWTAQSLLERSISDQEVSGNIPNGNQNTTLNNIRNVFLENYINII